MCMNLCQWMKRVCDGVCSFLGHIVSFIIVLLFLYIVERALSQRLYSKELNFFPKRRSYSTIPKKVTFPIPRSGSPSNSGGSKDEPSDDAKACISTSL